MTRCWKIPLSCCRRPTPYKEADRLRLDWAFWVFCLDSVGCVGSPPSGSGGQTQGKRSGAHWRNRQRHMYWWRLQWGEWVSQQLPLLPRPRHCTSPAGPSHGSRRCCCWSKAPTPTGPWKRRMDHLRQLQSGGRLSMDQWRPSRSCSTEELGKIWVGKTVFINHHGCLQCDCSHDHWSVCDC